MCLVMAMSLILLAVLTDIIPVHSDIPFIFNYGILLLSLFSSQVICVFLQTGCSMSLHVTPSPDHVRNEVHNKSK